MRLFKNLGIRWTLPALALGAMTLWYCEQGDSLNPIDPGAGSGKIPIIAITAAKTSLLPVTDSVMVNVTIVDSAGAPLAGEPLTVISDRFSFVHPSSATAYTPPDTVPSGGSLAFRVTSSQTGTGRVIVRAGTGTNQRSDTLILIVTERPVPPRIVEEFPNSMTPADSPVVTITVLDSTRATPTPLQNAEVFMSSSFFRIFEVGNSRTVSVDTTGTDGKVSFRVNATQVGTGSISVRVRTAAGVERTTTLTITVTNIPSTDRPRQMVFTAARSILKADGSDSTDLVVVVKDDNNNPLQGEKIRFTSTGGLVQAEATTDAWGKAVGLLISERVNKTVVVTATLVKTGATAQQTVTFDGITIKILPSRKVLMRDSIVNVVYELTDANGNPMSGDTLEVLADSAYRGFNRRLSSTTQVRDSMLVAIDTRGQFRATVTRNTAGRIFLMARALGASALDTITFTNNTLTMTASPGQIVGNGTSTSNVTATLRDGNGAALVGYELRWTTTFGAFTSSPFTLSNSSGQSTITLRAPVGSGLATVNVEAYNKSTGQIAASTSITIRVTAMPVKRLTLRITPDNIPVKVGEAKLVAQAYDSADNVMTNVLIGFRLIKGAGGGDEVIAPPVDFTQQGFAQSSIKAGGVISFYHSVKISAVALDIVGTDTLVIASSDTVGLTISGPPHKVSVGANILKGINPEDGTFLLPTAAVVTDVNGNLVADGTQVNFGVHPVIAHHQFLDWGLRGVSWSYWFPDTVYEDLPWTDYNNNMKLDADETPSRYNRNNPFRGEDQDGNGVIWAAPEPFEDLNEDGYWSNGTTGKASRLAEPEDVWFDSAGRAYTYFLDINRNGRHDTAEVWSDLNNDSLCQCTGQYSANGALYEDSYFGSPANRPYPGYSSIGIERQVATTSGKATTNILYVQSDAVFITVRITAESNGIRNSADVRLPIILGGGKK